MCPLEGDEKGFIYLLLKDSDSDVLLLYTIYKTYNFNSIYRNYIY